jgi:hypothetical protein
MFAAGTVIGAENEGLKYDQSLWTGSGLKVEQELARREATRWDQMTLGQRAIEWSKYVVACAPGRHPPTRLLAGRVDPSSPPSSSCRDNRTAVLGVGWAST